MELAIKLWSDEADTLYDYEIVANDDGGFKLWVSTGPLRGKYLNKEPFDSIPEALRFLAKTIEDGEVL